jgi:hypothetical protein
MQKRGAECYCWCLLLIGFILMLAVLWWKEENVTFLRSDIREILWNSSCFPSTHTVNFMWWRINECIVMNFRELVKDEKKGIFIHFDSARENPQLRERTRLFHFDIKICCAVAKWKAAIIVRIFFMNSLWSLMIMSFASRDKFNGASFLSLSAVCVCQLSLGIQDGRWESF